MSKVKHFKDETFGELQALEIENEQLHKENLRLKERVRLLEDKSHSKKEQIWAAEEKRRSVGRKTLVERLDSLERLITKHKL